MRHTNVTLSTLHFATPEQCEYIVGYLPGGLGRFVVTLKCQDCDALWDGRGLKWSKPGCQPEAKNPYADEGLNES